MRLLGTRPRSPPPHRPREPLPRVIVALVPELVVSSLYSDMIVEEGNARREPLVHRRHQLQIHHFVAQVQVGCGDDVAKHLGDPLDPIHSKAVVVPLDGPFVGALAVATDVSVTKGLALFGERAWAFPRSREV